MTSQVEQPADLMTSEYDLSKRESHKSLRQQIESDHEEILQSIGLSQKRELLRVSLDLPVDDTES